MKDRLHCLQSLLSVKCNAEKGRFSSLYGLQSAMCNAGAIADLVQTQEKPGPLLTAIKRVLCTAAEEQQVAHSGENAESQTSPKTAGSALKRKRHREHADLLSLKVPAEGQCLKSLVQHLEELPHYNERQFVSQPTARNT